MSPKDKQGRSSSPTSSAPKPGQATPPPSRRSARQERLANRQTRRYDRTTGSFPKSGLNPILIWTGLAIAVAVVLIGGAFLLTQPKSISGSGFTAPTVVTPSTVPSSGQTLGSATAAVTLDLYSDFRCTGCGTFAKTLEPQIVSNFLATGKAKLVYRDFLTIDGLDGQQGIKTTASRDAANAGLCAADEGKFWLYHDWLFANQSPSEDPSAFTIDRLIGIAKAAGIDNPGFESCVRQGTHNAEVANEQASAPASIDATPTLFVNGKVVPSSRGANYLPTDADIAAAIKAAATSSPSPASAAPSAS